MWLVIELIFPSFDYILELFVCTFIHPFCVKLKIKIVKKKLSEKNLFNFPQ